MQLLTCGGRPLRCVQIAGNVKTGFVIGRVDRGDGAQLPFRVAGALLIDVELDQLLAVKVLLRVSLDQLFEQGLDFLGVSHALIDAQLEKLEAEVVLVCHGGALEQRQGTVVVAARRLFCGQHDMCLRIRGLCLQGGLSLANGSVAVVQLEKDCRSQHAHASMPVIQLTRRID